MSVALKHIFIFAKDTWEAARFFGTLLGLPDPQVRGEVLSIELDRAYTVYLARVRWGLSVLPQHYAFEVSNDNFDSMYDRIQDQGLTHWGGRHRENLQSFGSDATGRQVFLFDSNGHIVEVFAAAEQDLDTVSYSARAFH